MDIPHQTDAETSKSRWWLLAAVLGALVLLGTGCEVSETQRFEKITPCRIADTRVSQDNITQVSANLRRVQVAGECGVGANATSAAVTLTVAGSAGAGFFTAYPGDMTRPDTSNLNWTAGERRSNMAILGLDDAGTLLVYSSRADAELIIDVNGAFVPDDSSKAGRFQPVTPRRIVTPVTIGAQATLTVPRPSEVPADALAVMVNVTSSNHPTSSSFLTAHAAGTSRPATAFLNSMPNAPATAATTIVPISASGFRLYSEAGATVRVDLVGYFTGSTASESDVGLFRATTPTRVADTRTAQAPGIFDGGTRRILGGLPTDGLVANYTLVNASAPTFLTTFSAGTSRPGTSTVNGVPGRSTANLMVNRPSSHGIDVYASRQTHVVVDVTGFFQGTALPVANPLAAVNAPPDPLRAVSSPNVGSDCATSLSAGALSDRFENGIGAMTGADYQRASHLPDGRVLWLLQDAFLTTPSGPRLVHNVGVIQSGRCFTLLHGGSAANPTSWIAAGQTNQEQRWYWAMGGEVSFDQQTYRLVLAEMEEEGASYLDHAVPQRTVMVDIDLPSLSVGGIYQPPHSSTALYGFSVTSDASYTYLYGHCYRQFGFDEGNFQHGACAEYAYVARVPRGELHVAAEYWAGGSNWSPSPAAAARVFDRFDTFSTINPAQVIWDGTQFVATIKAGDFLGQNALFFSSANPYGPWTLYDNTSSLPLNCSNAAVCNNYFTSWVPWRNPNGNMIFGWSNNLWSGNSATSAVYRPRFTGVVNP